MHHPQTLPHRQPHSNLLKSDAKAPDADQEEIKTRIRKLSSILQSGLIPHGEGRAKMICDYTGMGMSLAAGSLSRSIEAFYQFTKRDGQILYHGANNVGVVFFTLTPRLRKYLRARLVIGTISKGPHSIYHLMDLWERITEQHALKVGAMERDTMLFSMSTRGRRGLQLARGECAGHEPFPLHKTRFGRVTRRAGKTKRQWRTW
jgi:hypothetical protein